MLANWVKQATATTGTGTMTLGSAETSYVTFGDQFSDGDVVYYSIEDGNDREIGIGTYTVSGTTLSRDTVLETLVSGTFDNTSPAAINLSGSAIVSVSENSAAIVSNSPNAITGDNAQIWNGLLISSAAAATVVIGADEQQAYAFRLMQSSDIASIAVNVVTADGSGLASLGVTKIVNGIPGDTYICNATIDITSGGVKTVTVGQVLEAGYYAIHIVTDSATAAFTGVSNGFSASGIAWTPYRKQTNANRNHPLGFLGKTKTLGVLDAAPESVTGNSQQGTVDKMLTFYFIGA